MENNTLTLTEAQAKLDSLLERGIIKGQMYEAARSRYMRLLKASQS